MDTTSPTYLLRWHVFLVDVNLEGKAEDGRHAAQLMQLLARHVQRGETEEAPALGLDL